MVAYLVTKVPEVVELLEPKLKRKPGFYLGDAYEEQELKQARSLCRQTDFLHQYNTKLVICAFSGSSILGQLAVVREYSFECEVLVPVFDRYYSHWTGEVRGEDKLDT